VWFPSRSFLAYVRELQKLIKRQIFPEHLALLVKRQDELLVELKATADEGFPRAKEEWERSVAAWGNAYIVIFLWCGTEVLTFTAREETREEQSGEYDYVTGRFTCF
jgi:hypothetical protein